MCVRVPILYDFSNQIFDTILTLWYFCGALINKRKLSNLCMGTCLLEPNVATSLTTPRFIECLYQGRKVSGHVVKELRLKMFRQDPVMSAQHD